MVAKPVPDVTNIFNQFI